MIMSMKFDKKEISPEEIVLEVHGTLMGSESTDVFQKNLEDVTQAKHRMITLNFMDVDAINSSCIGKIFLYKKKLEEHGRKIQIRGCSENLHKTFQLIKLEQLITIER
jgi:anti-anti-sigma factor